MAAPASEATMDRRMRKTRRAIREALQTLLQNGAIEQITIKDIAAEADIGYTTFFRHFPSKEAALADLADTEAAELIDFSFPLLSSQDSRASCIALCRHVDEKRRVWSALLTSGAAGIVRDALAAHTLERAGDWPAARAWLPEGAGTTLVIGLTVEVLTWWLSSARQLSAEQVGEIMDRLFVAQLIAQSD
ncbi:TetR/AcrR family transcriptional regulator [Novosphingobium sp. BL-8A]|uniref:TetR/AcrR family transcriptional regulator n=1 Tax=Novosphingobium sp. BL-8A TaxID=3127639 RepID=UPI0037584645